MTLNHDEIKSLLGAYVLGSLLPDELTMVRSHIMSCDVCMREADELTETATAIALTTEELPTPEGFADRIMRRVATERPSSASAEISRPVPLRRPWRARVAVLAGGVALATIALGFSLSFYSERRAVQARDSVLDSVVHSNVGLGLKSSSGQLIGRVVPTDLGALFIAEGMSKLPDSKTYQLWLMSGCTDGTVGCKVVSAGTFESPGGIAFLRTSRSLEHFDAAAVTIEPAGGSDQPTKDPIITSAG